jgi:hypothetical protein
VLLIFRDTGASKVANWLKESVGFSNNIKKSSPLIIRDRRLILALGLMIITSICKKVSKDEFAPETSFLRILDALV